MALCVAHSSRTKKPCRHHAIKGGTVCQTHGGSAPQVKATAARRVAAMEFGLAFATDSNRVLAELGCIAGVRLADLYGEDGRLLGVKEMPEHVQAAIAAVEAVTGNTDPGDGKRDLLSRVRLLDKLKALEVLSKHHGLQTERVEHSGGLEIKWQD
jgi:hypothetical protein